MPQHPSKHSAEYELTCFYFRKIHHRVKNKFRDMMLPISLLKSAVSVVSSAGHGSKFSVFAVAHPHCYRHPTSVRSSSTKADLESIRKLADEADNASEETSLVKKETTDSSLISRGPLPLITKRELQYLHPSRTPRQAWVENLDTKEEKKLGLVDLHPDVFGTFPRIELISANVIWQQKYKTVNWNWSPTRGEVHGPNSKPWPQKGLGKARHGDRRSPIWIKGGKAHGPRGPKSYFYMLPYYTRVHGLTSTLSVKLAQDDLKIVDTLDLPTDDPKYLEDLVSERHWGISVLFVDDTDIVPKNIALATDNIAHMNIMPVYGLNVFSMLKHETLVLTLAAVNKIEEKLVMHLNRHEGKPPTGRKQRHAFV